MEPKRIGLIFLALCLFFAFSMSPAEAGGERGRTKCNDGDDNDGDGKIDGEDEDCFSSFKPNDDDSGRAGGLNLIATLDDTSGDNLMSDTLGDYVHNEGHMKVVAGGQLPSRIGIHFSGGGKDPRELSVENVSCDTVGGGMGCHVLENFPRVWNQYLGRISVQRANVSLEAVPYEVCPFGVGNCPDVFTMAPATPELMSFRVLFHEGLLIEIASAIGGATSVDAGRCLSLLTPLQRNAFLSTQCLDSSQCNVTVEAFDDGDGENDAWTINSLDELGEVKPAKALICRLGPGDNFVIGQTTLTFGFTAVKKP